MAIKYCVTVFGFICFMDIYAGVVPDKIYYCMDPDTKILHPVNTSWPSSTFCGNYTCRMRKKGQMDLEYSPSNRVNSSHIDKNSMKSEVVVSTEKKAKVDVLNIFHKDFNKKPLGENDRYLTEDEIKTITTLLHSAKKSDLDAIIEIYNLAQDIYKEIDKNLHSTDEAPPSGVDKVKMDDIETVPNKRVSYWYEPINVRGSIDKAHKGSNAVDIGVKSSYVNPIMRVGNAQTYYQPIGHFQKKFSYAHHIQTPTPYTPVVRASTVGELDSLSCNKPLAANYVAVSPWFSRVMKPQFPVTSDKKQEPSLLLPYPFAFMHHYNVSSYPRSPHFTQTYIDDSQKLPQDAVFLVNEDLLEDVGDMSVKLSVKRAFPESVDNVAMHEQDKMNPKTTGLNDHIPTKVSKSIININKHKPLLKKETSLENYLESNKNVRFKRDSVNSSKMSIEYDNYETYIEKTECKPDTEPGYFAKGNESQPFPGCCPRRIVEHFREVDN